MAIWQELDVNGLIHHLKNLWAECGGSALQARGTFLVGMDAGSLNCQLLKEMAGGDWPWSSTRILPLRENLVDAHSQRHCRRRLFQALYPHHTDFFDWPDRFRDPEEKARQFERVLRREGDHPRLDLCLIHAHGEFSLGECRGTPGENRLTAVYEVPRTHSLAVGVTPYFLQRARSSAVLSAETRPSIRPHPEDCGFVSSSQLPEPLYLATAQAVSEPKR